jgi:hypothetical protein
MRPSRVRHTPYGVSHRISVQRAGATLGAGHAPGRRQAHRRGSLLPALRSVERPRGGEKRRPVRVRAISFVVWRGQVRFGTLALTLARARSRGHGCGCNVQVTVRQDVRFDSNEVGQ